MTSRSFVLEPESAGLECRVPGKWGLGISSRYDHICPDVDSKIADFELDGISAQLYLNLGF